MKTIESRTNQLIIMMPTIILEQRKGLNTTKTAELKQKYANVIAIPTREQTNVIKELKKAKEIEHILRKQMANIQDGIIAWINLYFVNFLLYLGIGRAQLQ